MRFVPPLGVDFARCSTVPGFARSFSRRWRDQDDKSAKLVFHKNMSPLKEIREIRPWLDSQQIGEFWEQKVAYVIQAWHQQKQGDKRDPVDFFWQDQQLSTGGAIVVPVGFLSNLRNILPTTSETGPIDYIRSLFG